MGEIVGMLGEFEGVGGDRLFAVLEKRLVDSRGRVNIAALAAMGKLRGVEAGKVLGHLKKYVAFTKEGRFAPLRRAAAEVLGELGGRQVHGPLEEGYAFSAARGSWHEAPVRLALIEAARKTEALGLLRNAAGGDPFPDVRVAAFNALGELGGVEDLPLCITAVSMRIGAESSAATICFAAARAMGKIGGPKTRDALLARLRVEKKPKVREVIADTLRETFPGDPQVIAALKSFEDE